MSARHWISILLLPAFITACAENPTSPATGGGGGDDGGDDHADPTSDLVVDLQLSSSHVHILSELTLTATVTDHHGEAVTDFDSLVVERKAADSDTWRAINLELQGDSYVGAYTFASSGDYDLRVAGRRPHDAAMVQMHQMTETSPMHLSAVRAHGDLGPYRVEFESFPGHIHTGEVATVRFWVMEAEADADGNRAPITGLTDAQIHCVDSADVEELHDVTEVEPGVYEADHEFLEAGHFHAGIHKTIDGESHEAAFELNIAHGH